MMSKFMLRPRSTVMSVSRVSQRPHVQTSRNVLYMLIMAALCNRGAIIFLPCSFFLSIFFFSSPNLSGRRLDVYHTFAHGVALVRI